MRLNLLLPLVFFHQAAVLGSSLSTRVSSSEVAFASNSTQSGYKSTFNPPCDALVQAGLREQVLFPTDAAYEPQIDTYWTVNNRQHPWCMALPRSSQDLSKILTILRGVESTGDWHIAVRSGGHHYQGTNNIDNGVTVDLSYMNQSTYNAGSNLASVQPGARWKNVYADLEKSSNVTVPGGRDGGVGVGGFTLGGGSNFYMGRVGFACDAVANYEVVLVNGSILNANQNQNSDLWKALKGGLLNFGVVSRYDFEALPNVNLSYSQQYMSLNQSESVINFTHNFTNLSESQAANDALVVYWSNLTPENPDMLVNAISVNTMGEASSNLQPLRSLPVLERDSSSRSMATAAAGSEITDGFSGVGSTITFKNDLGMMRYVKQRNDQFFADLKTLLGAGNFFSFAFLQPIPTYYNEIGKRHGGNVLGLDQETSNSILWTGGVGINATLGQGLVAASRLLLTEFAADIRTRAEATNNTADLVYMNYADLAQNPLGSYGEENVEFIKSVAQKYDPEGFFQTRVPGGFKISRVG